MKKVINIVLGIVLILSLSACSSKENTSYKDGTYTAQGDEWEYGNEESVVVIENSKIKNINLKRLDKEGKEVDYEQWTGQTVDGKLWPNLKQYKIDLANKMVENQTYEVDSISGATTSSENWKLAVKRVLEESSK